MQEEDAVLQCNASDVVWSRDVINNTYKNKTIYNIKCYLFFSPTKLQLTQTLISWNFITGLRIGEIIIGTVSYHKFHNNNGKHNILFHELIYLLRIYENILWNNKFLKSQMISNKRRYFISYNSYKYLLI